MIYNDRNTLVQRNDGSKATVVEIMKHDVRNVKQFCRVMRSTKI